MPVPPLALVRKLPNVLSFLLSLFFSRLNKVTSTSPRMASALHHLCAPALDILQWFWIFLVPWHSVPVTLHQWLQREIWGFLSPQSAHTVSWQHMKWAAWSGTSPGTGLATPHWHFKAVAVSCCGSNQANPNAKSSFDCNKSLSSPSSPQPNSKAISQPQRTKGW